MGFTAFNPSYRVETMKPSFNPLTFPLPTRGRGSRFVGLYSFRAFSNAPATADGFVKRASWLPSSSTRL